MESKGPSAATERWAVRTLDWMYVNGVMQCMIIRLVAWLAL